MKMKTFASVLVVFSVQAHANYGIKPPVAGAPSNGEVSVPRTPGRVAQPSIGIGEFEEIQIVVSNVLKKANVKPERVAKYQKALVKIATQDKETKSWLYDLNNYFDSKEFTQQSKSEKEKDQFDARMMIDMTMGVYDADPVK